MNEYYICTQQVRREDKNTYVFWMPDENGYTNNVLKAGLYPANFNGGKYKILTEIDIRFNHMYEVFMIHKDDISRLGRTCIMIKRN